MFECTVAKQIYVLRVICRMSILLYCRFRISKCDFVNAHCTLQCQLSAISQLLTFKYTSTCWFSFNCLQSHKLSNQQLRVCVTNKHLTRTSLISIICCPRVPLPPSTCFSRLHSLDYLWMFLFYFEHLILAITAFPVHPMYSFYLTYH